MKFCEKILSRNFDLSESWLTKGMGQNNIFILKKSKSVMRLEPWTSSLSSQRYNKKSIFRILIPSIIKWNWLLCDSVVLFIEKFFITIFRQFRT